jgi:hypothetical protein
MKILYTAGGAVPAGVETDLNIVVAADGSRVPDGLTLGRALAMSGAEPVLERRFSAL